MTDLQIPAVPLKVSASIYCQQSSLAFVFLSPYFKIIPIYRAAFSNKNMYLFLSNTLPSWVQSMIIRVKAIRLMSLFPFCSLTYQSSPPFLFYILLIRIKEQFHFATGTLFNLEFMKHPTPILEHANNREQYLNFLSNKSGKPQYPLLQVVSN